MEERTLRSKLRESRLMSKRCNRNSRWMDRRHSSLTMEMMKRMQSLSVLRSRSNRLETMSRCDELGST